MPEQKSKEISRDRLAELLNEDLAREYQAIIAYVVYSRVGAVRWRQQYLEAGRVTHGFSPS